MDEIRDLEFSTGREGESSEYLEYLVIELVIADIGEIPDTRIGWFLDYPSRPTLTITGEYPKEFRIVYSFAECCVSFLFSESDDIATLIEIIT